MLIRSLERKDQPFVEHIMREHSLQFPPFIIEQYPKRWNAYLIDKSTGNNGYFVMEDEEGNILGHAGFLFNMDLNLYELVGVVVKKESKRQGIGRKLIQTICEKMIELGEKKVILYTLGHAENQDTLTFYKQLGFDRIEYEKDFFTTDFDRVTFIKTM